MKIKEISFQNAHIKHDFDAENPSYDEDKATSSFLVKIRNHSMVHTCFGTHILQQNPMQLTKNLLYIKLRVVS